MNLVTDTLLQYAFDSVGLDNLHEYLKFSYPRMRAPSFFCENESSTGLTLHYRSKRRGFVHYTMGQIKQVRKRETSLELDGSLTKKLLGLVQVGKVIYNKDVEIDIIKEEMLFHMHVVTFNLKFDNRAFTALSALDRDDQCLPLKPSIFIDIFPFCILFGYSLCSSYI